MPPRGRVDSLNTQVERRYNFRPRTRLVQPSGHVSINRDVDSTSSILQHQTRYNRRPRVRCIIPRVRSTQSTRLNDPTSIEYTYDQCDQVFYTPERRIYSDDIPCYTLNNNDMLNNSRYIQLGMQGNRDYTDGIQSITTLSNCYTSITRHRTPPRTLSDALYYTFDDVIQPIKSYITSTQLIVVIILHVILSISIY